MRELRPRETLFKQGAPVTHIYLLREGTVFQDRTTGTGKKARVSLRREVPAGQFVGQYDLLYGQQHSTRARALNSCKLVAIEANALNRLLYAYPDIRESLAPMTLIGRLRTLPFFERIDTTSLCLLAEMCEQWEFEDGEFIYDIYDNAERVFIIDEGQICLESPTGENRWLGNGMEFGFLEQIHEDPAIVAQLSYGHSAAAVGKAHVFAWPREIIHELSGIHPERMAAALQTARSQAIHAISVFADFSEEQREKLLGYMSHYYFPVSHIVMQQGEVGDSLWVLLSNSRGTLRALDGTQAMQPTTVYGPNFFNELALRVQHPMDSTVQAETNSQWLRLHRDDFAAFLSDTDATLQSKLKMGPAAERKLGRIKTRRKYKWLQENERLITFQRRHILVLTHRLFPALLLLIAVATAGYGFYRMGWTERWAQFTLAIPSLVVVWLIFWNVVNYLNDYILVTNQRIVHQEKVLFFTEFRKAASLEQVRNIDIQTTFFGRLANYGAIVIQTAATEGAIKFDFVPYPHRLRQTMTEQQSQRMQHYQASTKMVIQDLLQERLGMQLQLPAMVTANRDDGRITTAARVRDGLGSIRKRLHTPVASREVVVWRKHWLRLVGRILMPIVIIGLLGALFASQQLIPPEYRQYLGSLDIGVGAIAFVCLLWILWNYADWRNDTYEVDYKQIADVSKKPLFFAEQRRTGLLSEIENIEVSIPSPIHYLFNFGNVRIQTAATDGDFTFDWVANPRGVSEEIRRRIETSRQRQEDARAKQRAEELPDWFEMYDRLGMESQRRMSTSN